MLPVSYLLYPLLCFLIVNSSSSAGLIRDLSDFDDHGIELLLRNFISPEPEVHHDYFPITDIPPGEAPVRTPPTTSWPQKILHKIAGTLINAAKYLQGNRLSLSQAEAYQDSANQIYRTHQMSSNAQFLFYVGRITELPVEDLVLSADVRQQYTMNLREIISDGMMLLDDNSLAFSDRLWIHQMIQWLAAFSPTEHPDLKIKKPHEERLTRAQLERYLLQDTLLQNKVYPYHDLSIGSPIKSGHIAEIMDRVSLMKEIKDEVKNLFIRRADSNFQKMFDTLMVVNFVRFVDEPALEQKRLALIERLYRLIYAVFNNDAATQEEVFLTYAVCEHLLTHVPPFRKKIDTLLSGDPIFMLKFHTAEAMVMARRAAMVMVRRALSSISEPLKGLILPLEKLENTSKESIGNALQRMTSSNVLSDQDRMQIYLSVTSVCRLNKLNDEYFHNQLQVKLEGNLELLNRVSTLWQSMYPEMSLQSMPETSYEYELFQKYPMFLEYSERYLIVRQSETSNKIELGGIQDRVLNLPFQWYEDRSERDAKSLVKEIIELLSSQKLIASSQDQKLPWNFLILYQLLAQLINHNWKSFSKLLMKKYSENLELKENLTILAQITSESGFQVSPFTRHLCKELSKWIHDHT